MLPCDLGEKHEQSEGNKTSTSNQKPRWVWNQFRLKQQTPSYEVVETCFRLSRIKSLQRLKISQKLYAKVLLFYNIER
jgi:hypothetical protein